MAPTMDNIKQLIVAHLQTGETKPSKLVAEVISTVEEYVESITDATPVPVLHCRAHGGFGFSKEFEAFLKSRSEHNEDGPDAADRKYGGEPDLYTLVRILEFGRSLPDMPDENTDQFIKASLKKASGSYCSLAVAWVPKNRQYSISEYDGYERVIIGTVKDP